MRGLDVGVLFTGLEKVAVQGILFVQSILLARLLCPSDFGLTAMLGIFLGLGSTLAESGLGTAYVVYGGKAHKVLAWNVGIALGCYALLFFGAPLIARFYQEETLCVLVRVMGLGIVFNAASVIGHANLQRTQRFRALAFVNVGSVFASMLAAVVLAWRGAGVWAIAAGGLVYALVRVICLLPYAKGSDGKCPFGKLLSYGLKLTASGLIHTVYINCYQLVIGKLYSAAAVGLFARGQRWSALPADIFNESVGRVALPNLAQRTGSAQRYFLLNAVLLWPVLVFLWVFAPEIVGTVLGRHWLDCVPYLRILVFGQFFTPIGGMALLKIRASGHAEVVLKTDAWKKPIGLAFLCVGAPFGVAGLCWSKVANDVVEAVVDLAFAWSVSNKSGARLLMDTNLAYRVYGDLRSLLWRYELLIHRPRLGPKTHADTWCHYLVALLECGKSVRFARILERYLRLGGDVSHFAKYFRLSELAVARGLANPAVVRTSEVWLKLRESRRKTPLASFVEGKTVALVGNGPQEIGKGLGDEIDSHDVVIRMNNYVLAGIERDYGRRTDVWVKNSTQEMKHVKPSEEIRIIVYNGNLAREQLAPGECEHLAADLADERVAVDYIGAKDRLRISEAIGAVPTTGGLLVNMLARCDCKSVDVYGFACIAGDDGRPENYRRLPQDTPAETVRMFVEWHRFDREVAYLSDMFDGRRLRK